MLLYATICNVHAIVCYHLAYATVCYKLHVIIHYRIAGDDSSVVRCQCATEEHPADIRNCHPQPSGINQTQTPQAKRGKRMSYGRLLSGAHKLRPEDTKALNTSREISSVSHQSRGLCVLWGTNQGQTRSRNY